MQHNKYCSLKLKSSPFFQVHSDRGCLVKIKVIADNIDHRYQRFVPPCFIRLDLGTVRAGDLVLGCGRCASDWTVPLTS